MDNMINKTPNYVVALCLLVLCIAVLFFFYIPAVIESIESQADRNPSVELVGYDFYSYFLPKYAFGSEEMRRGFFPIWNRFEYCGIPFTATAQPATLYPPKIIAFALFEPETAYQVYLIFHYAAMAFFFLLFARERDINAVGAMAGSVSWAFCSLMLFSNYQPNRLSIFTWVPLFFLFVERIAARKNARDFVGLILVLAFEFVAGYPEICLDLAILVTLYAVSARVFGDWQSPPWKTVPLFAAAFIVAASISSFQLISLVDALQESKRSNLVVPNALPLTAYFSTLSEANVVLIIRFIPLLSFPALIAFALIGFTRRDARQPTFCLFICLFVALGGWSLLRLMPGFRAVRFPLVWYFIAPFFAAWIVAIGTDAFIRSTSFNRPRLSYRWVVGICTGLFVCGCLAQLYFLSFDKDRWIDKLWDYPLVSFNGQTEIIAGLGLLGGCILLAILFIRLSERMRSWGVLLFLLFVTLSHNAGYLNLTHVAPMKQPQAQSRIRQMRDGPNPIKGRVFSLFDVRHGYAMTERIESLIGAETSLLPWRFRVLFERLRIKSFFHYKRWELLVSASGFLDAVNLQYLIAPMTRGDLLSSYGLKKIKTSGNKEGLFENTDRMGNAWINYDIEIADSPENAMKKVLDNAFDPRKKVILERPPSIPYSAHRNDMSTPVTVINRKSPTEVEYQVELEQPGILVVSESGYPGWHAYVDGRKSEWLHADFLLRAVELGPGSHTVRFKYQPWWMNAMWTITATGLLVLLLTIFSKIWLPTLRKIRFVKSDARR